MEKGPEPCQYTFTALSASNFQQEQIRASPWQGTNSAAVLQYEAVGLLPKKPTGAMEKAKGVLSHHAHRHPTSHAGLA
jgi:hypothetical protein